MSKEIINKSMKGEISVNNTSFEHNGKTYTGAMFEILLSQR